MTYDLVSLSLCTSCPSSLGGLYVLLSAWILHGFNLKSILWIVWIHRKKPSACLRALPGMCWGHTNCCCYSPWGFTFDLFIRKGWIAIWNTQNQSTSPYFGLGVYQCFSFGIIEGVWTLSQFHRKEVARVSSLGVSNLFPIDWSCDTCELPRFPVNFEPCLATLFFGGLSETNEHVGISIVHVCIYIYISTHDAENM